MFSFGVVLLELVTGKAAVVNAEEGGGECRGLAEWAAIMKHNMGKAIKDLLDRDLLYDYGTWGDEIDKVFEISLLCTRPSPRHRPSMGRVVDFLSSPAPVVLEDAHV